MDMRRGKAGWGSIAALLDKDISKRETIKTRLGLRIANDELEPNVAQVPYF
jgi:hypothetical protein